MTARPTVAATAWPPINQPTADTTIAGSDIFCQRFFATSQESGLWSHSPASNSCFSAELLSVHIPPSVWFGAG